MEYWVAKVTIRQFGVDRTESIFLCCDLEEMLEAISEKNCLENDGVAKVVLEYFEDRLEASLRHNTTDVEAD